MNLKVFVSSYRLVKYVVSVQPFIIFPAYDKHLHDIGFLCVSVSPSPSLFTTT